MLNIFLYRVEQSWFLHNFININLELLCNAQIIQMAQDIKTVQEESDLEKSFHCSKIN